MGAGRVRAAGRYGHADVARISWSPTEEVREARNAPFGSQERPAWFDDSIRRVLDGAGALVAATSPRELEQLTTELVGAQLYRAIHDIREGLRFDWWFADLDNATRNANAEACPITCANG